MQKHDNKKLFMLKIENNVHTHTYIYIRFQLQLNA